MSRLTHFVVTLVVSALVSFSTAPASEPAELRELFPSEADVFATESGLARLDLTAEILAACRPDLSDLRLFDLEEEQIAFVVDSRRPPVTAVELTRRVDAPILEAARNETRRQREPSLRTETFQIAMPDEPAPTGAWTLVIGTRQREFVARVRIAAIPDDGKTPLIDEASLFRLPGSGGAEKLRLILPSTDAEGLEITLESQRGFWLEPVFRFESSEIYERDGRIEIPLEALSSRRVDGKTILDLARPRGVVPDLLRLATGTGTFDRNVIVRDDGPGADDKLLADASVFRVEALVTVEDLEISMRQARGDRLRVEIDGGDSPALEDLRVSAVVRQPSLIFSLEQARENQKVATLRFGGGRAYLPRYDLAGLLAPRAGTVRGGKAEAVAVIYDVASLTTATLGDSRSNTAFDREPALAFAMRPGAAIDPRVFSHRRSLQVASSPEGLSSFTLAPNDLAILRGDLADLRVADGSSKQWPYLVERDAARTIVDLPVADPASEDGESSYTLELPVQPMRPDQLILDTDLSFFDRSYRLEAKLTGTDGPARTLIDGQLRRRAGDPRPLSLSLPSARIESLTLIVDDGDDAPIDFRSIQVRVPLPEIFVAAVEGEYSLLLGSPEEKTPRYELSRVRNVVLAVRSTAAEPGDLLANPEFSLNARLGQSGLQQSVLLWIALVGAAVVLVFLTLRLARKESPSG